MKPQDYSARTTYRRAAGWYRRLNWLGVPLTSLGLAPRDAVTLEVRGRSSGKLRRVPILRTRYLGEDYLVSLAGESQWVRNVRATHGEALIRRGRLRHVHLTELPPEDRPAIIAQYLHAGRRRSGAHASEDQARFYFGLKPDPSAEDILAIADHYPVFRVSYEPNQRQAHRAEEVVRIEGAIRIARPTEDVFDFVADQRNEPAYNPRMVSVQKLTPGPIGTGTRWLATVESRGRPLDVEIEVTDYSRPNRLGSTTHMPIAEIQGAITFEPLAVGTRMSWSWNLQLNGPLKFISPFVARIGRRQEAQIWAGLKRHLEAH